MLAQNEVIVRLGGCLPSLEPLFLILGRLQIKRFAVRRFSGVPRDSQAARDIQKFCEIMKPYALGERGTWGWPRSAVNVDINPQYLDCWNWGRQALETVQAQFPHWLALDDHNPIHWSFFRGTRLVLNLPGDGTAFFKDLLEDEIAELRNIGLCVDVIDKRVAPQPDPDMEKSRRAPMPYFGSHEQIGEAIERRSRPFWWTPEHDSLILEQVKEDQWRWRPDSRAFTKSLTKAELQRHQEWWEAECAAGRGYEVWYNGIGAYIHKRAIELGAHNLVRTAPEMKRCAACSQEFHETSAREMFLGRDQIDICTPCFDAAAGGQRDDLSCEETLHYLQRLAQILGGPPPSDFGQLVAGFLLGFSTEQRAQIIVALRNRPTLRSVNNQFGSWFNALKEAGVLDQGAQRNVMGTTCLATDGHVCLSIAEKRIDDLLTSLGIPHDREIHYGGSKFRADFVVGKTIIEYFGLMNCSEYREKADKKAQYCREHNIPFLALFPEDVANEKVLTEKLSCLLPASR